ncbi:hypothetical protein BWI17_13055 [Betaproteobacteria bacterium GR16-43]|nr:hypothetical protein BWI17_13055 [Betaproteobacteria bacterium GR16-43]
METNDFAQVRSLFDAVIELPPEERETRLCELTDDGAIRERVRSLLAASGSTTHMSELLRTAISSASRHPQPGDVLGIWRIEREIGAGGMGSVYLVERDDGHYRKTAALKFVKGVPRPESLAYFTRERQLLATLVHPNIARLLDGGATAMGQPYLVMEFVEGAAIDRAARERGWSPHQAIEAMIEVCGAIAFAHGHLVVHCDIKPSNILVEAGGRPMLLDFGIARLLDAAPASDPPAGDPSGEGVPGSAAPTIARAFTPRYASPEQRRGEALSTATDVFSLGRLLDELLATARGSKPLDAELRAIVSRATEEDPAQRYASAAALASDLRRYLDRMPLEAMPATATYRVRKFAQRQWPALAGVALLAVVLAGSAVRVLTERDRAQSAEKVAVAERDATRAARAQALLDRDAANVSRTDAERERDRTSLAEQAALRERDSARQSEDRAVAERNRATAAQQSAAQFNAFLLSMFENEELADTDSPDISAVRIVDAAAGRVDRELANQPETQASIYRALGVIYGNLGRPRQAIDAFTRAIALERTLDRPLVLAELLSRNATLRSSNAEPGLAEKDAREALALRIRHAGPESAAASDTQMTLGILLARLQRWDESRTLLLAALATKEKLDGRESIPFAEANVALGRYYNLQPGSTREALPYLDTALGIYTRLLGESSRHAMTALAARALALRKLGRVDEAVADHRKAVDLRRQKHGESSLHVASAMQGLGATLFEVGRPLDATPPLRDAVALRKKVEATPSTLLGVNLLRLGEACAASGDTAGADAAFTEALAILRKTLPAGDTLIARALYFQGQNLVRSGRAAEAGAPLAESYEMWRKLFGESGNTTVDVKLARAERDLALGDLGGAHERIASLAKDVETLPAKRIDYLRLRGLEAVRAGNLDAGLADLKDAEERARKAGGDRDPRAARIALDRARVLVGAGRKAEAAALAGEIEGKLTPQLVPEASERVELRKLKSGS